MSLLVSSDHQNMDLRSQLEKKVSFRDEVTCHESDDGSSLANSSEEEFLPSVSSISEDLSDSLDGISRKSSRSFNNSDSRDIQNVLKKRYSKLAYSVQGVRQGSMKRSSSSRRLKR